MSVTYFVHIFFQLLSSKIVLFFSCKVYSFEIFKISNLNPDTSTLKKENYSPFTKKYRFKILNKMLVD